MMKYSNLMTQYLMHWTITRLSAHYNNIIPVNMNRSELANHIKCRETVVLKLSNCKTDTRAQLQCHAPVARKE